MGTTRIAQQIAFLVEADKLKGVLRRTPLVDSSRRENSAEHSWHLVLVALIMREHYVGHCDFLHVIELLAVHDLVEIDAGDTFAYDVSAQLTRPARETAAAERIFGLLPAEQGSHFRSLWEEFDAEQTPEARFANAVDRFQPLLQNAFSGGGTWAAHNLSKQEVLTRMAPIENALPALWPSVLDIIESFCASGLLRTVQEEM